MLKSKQDLCIRYRHAISCLFHLITLHNNALKSPFFIDQYRLSIHNMIPFNQSQQNLTLLFVYNAEKKQQLRKNWVNIVHTSY